MNESKRNLVPQIQIYNNNKEKISKLTEINKKPQAEIQKHSKTQKEIEDTINKLKNDLMTVLKLWSLILIIFFFISAK